MAIVRLEAMRSLAAFIEAEIPRLAGNVIVVQAPPEDPITYPKLAIVPTSWSFRPQQEEEFGAAGDDTQIVSVGRWETTIQLRATDATLFGRYELTEQLTELFLRREDAPSVLLTPVTACKEFGNFQASWELDDFEWQNEHAFSSQHWLTASVTGTVPALVTRGGVYVIEELRLGLADMGVTVTPATFDTDPRVEVVRINQDGSLTPL